MKTLFVPRLQLLRFLWTVCVLVVLVCVTPGSAGPDKHENLGEEQGSVAQAGSIAEIKFSDPRRFAVMMVGPGEIRNLYATGDVMFHPQDDTRAVVFEELGPRQIALRETLTGRKYSLRPGSSVPGFPGVAFIGTVVLERLEYRFKVVDDITREEPVLLLVEGSRAVLEKEVLHPPRRQTGRGVGDSGLVEGIPVREVSDNTYEVPEALVTPVVEKAGEVLSEIRPRFTRMYATRVAFDTNFTSRMGDVSLTDHGFTVTRPGVAKAFGIEVGDTILSLNGRPVNSPVNAWWTFQELFVKNRSLKELRVNIRRDGKQVTKTFRIR